MKKLILASRSPRRANILKQIGIEFEIIPSHADEETNVPAEPTQHVIELSRRKAKEISDQLNDSDGPILGADTIVAIGDKILGKPSDPTEAVAMLSKLNNNVHQVYTGITLIDPKNDKIISDYACTDVYFRQLRKEEITAYVATKEPMDKAGAYGIQGKGAILVEKIDGCYYNVVGLPVAKLLEMLKQI